MTFPPKFHHIFSWEFTCQQQSSHLSSIMTLMIFVEMAVRWKSKSNGLSMLHDYRTENIQAKNSIQEEMEGGNYRTLKVHETNHRGLPNTSLTPLNTERHMKRKTRKGKTVFCLLVCKQVALSTGTPVFHFLISYFSDD